jgi:hypothetical protein
MNSNMLKCCLFKICLFVYTRNVENYSSLFLHKLEDYAMTVKYCFKNICIYKYINKYINSVFLFLNLERERDKIMLFLIVNNC